jgi:hypothetical protein
VVAASRNADSAFFLTASTPDRLSIKTLPLAKIVRTFVNPASSNALATSAILRFTPPTFTPRKNAAYRVMTRTQAT